MHIPKEELDKYRETASKRMAVEARETARRREIAWQTARAAAEILKERFGADRVCAFGSVLREDRYSPWSDLDLAAWGLTADNWLKASATVRALSDVIEVNLVDVATCAGSLLQAIERDGSPL